VFTSSERELQFPTQGNYDPAAGTIEFFVRLPDIGPSGFSGSRGFWQTRGGTPLEKVRFVIGRGDFNRGRTGTRPEDLFADLLDGQLGLKTSIADWKARDWHHVAVLCDRKSARLLLDGACVARGEFPGLSPGAPVFDVGTNAFVVLDELRTSDVMREGLQVADNEVATLITVPLRFKQGKELVINADADNYPPGSSWLKVGLLDENMRPLEGFTGDDFDVLTSDEVEHVATWRGKADISRLSGKTFRLQSHLVNTRLYSFAVQ